MACRSLLLKLEKRGYIHLPAKKCRAGRNKKRKTAFPYVPHSTSLVSGNLKSVTPLSIQLVKDKEPLRLFKCFLSCYHYLGFGGVVGENMKYLVFDKEKRPLALLFFGSAAWKIAPRDEFIGWDEAARKANLQLVTNNRRFLILPWVKIPHLASHILGKVARRISSDWIKRYNHPVFLLESFVDKERFKGTCYQASNWIYVGQSKGRGRNDRHKSFKLPVKDIYLLPLVKRFKEFLTKSQ
jgi:hypothetical protein